MPTNNINIDSQIVVQTAAQWAVDATVYSAKRILVTSDAYYGATDQRKFKIADGVQAWSALDYFPVSGYDDASSSIQTQLNAKAPLFQPAFTDYIDLNEIADPASPGATAGRLWTSDANGKTNFNVVGSDGIKQRVMRDLISTVRNTTVAIITKGSIVYVTGATGTAPNVALAKADDMLTMPAVGVVMEDIGVNAYGRIQRFGRTEFNFDTSAWAVGTQLYVSPTVAGAFTSTVPTHPNHTQSAGVVVVSGVGNGSIFSAFTSWYNGHSDGTTSPTWTFGATAATSVKLAHTSTSQRTATFPNKDITVAGLSDVVSSTVMSALGDTIYGGALGVATRLAGQVTASKLFLSQTGDGVNSAAPVWSAVTSSDVGLGNVENTALSTWAGSTNLTTLGTVGTGTWNATAISKAKGGTGVDISSAALLLGTASTTAGQLTLSNATNAFTQTIRGTNPAASIIYDLPTTAPTLGQVLSATAPAAGIVTLSWATAAGGITINSTAITGGGANRLLFENSSNQVSETATDFYFQTATPFAHVFASGRTGTITGVNNTLYGYQAGKLITTETNNTAVGFQAFSASAAGSNFNTAIGSKALSLSSSVSTARNVAIGSSALGAITTLCYDNVAIGDNAMGTTLTATESNTVIGSGASPGLSGSFNTVIGKSAAGSATSIRNSVVIGYSAGANLTTGGGSTSYHLILGYTAGTTLGAASAVCTMLGNATAGTAAGQNQIAIGYGAICTADNQMVLGGNTGGFGDLNAVYIGCGVTKATPASITISSTGGSGTNNAGASMSFATRSTGNATPPNIIFQTGATLGSGTTLQTPATRLTIGELRVTAAVPIKLMGYTVATLPAAPAVGDLVYCTDLTAPTYLAAAVGGGAVVAPVFYDGVNWVSC